MNLDVHRLNELAYIPPAKLTEGSWQLVQVRPDFSSGELLNIGVICSHGDTKVLKVLDSFDKFSRLYGELAEDELRFLLRAVKSLVANDAWASTPPSIQFTAPRLARGTSAGEI